MAGVVPALHGAPGSHLDDLILTDGTKITGNIVGMEKGSFRVETDFGVALVRKDKVARIEVSPVPPPPPAPVAQPKAVVARPKPPAPATIQERIPPGGKIEEHVEGATYFNDSFGFQMFKPPNWKVLADTARDIPSAVAALGTEDESTMVVVGSVRFEGLTSAYARVLGSALQKIYADYETTPEEQIQVAGLPAIRHSFHGLANNRDWHGTVVNLADGPIHYGIIAVTSDENYQLKASVLNKMTTSFHFTK